MDKLRWEIDVLLFDGVNILDLAGPVQAFKSALIAKKRAYGLRFVSVDGQAVRACCGHGLKPNAKAELSQAHSKTPRDLLVPGGAGVAAALTNAALRALIEGWSHQHPEGRVTAVCSGALLLANSGVLDGKPATTHWSRDREITRHFPKVLLDLDQIYILQEGLATSAGVTAGIDMALSLVQADCGGACALQVA
jgi:transcriptional regulator GlxA family with amidase domain